MTWTRLCILGLMASFIGCADPNEDINLVQPHYVAKSQFNGQWLYKQTIVDVSPEIAIGFVGLEGALEKLEWVITHDFLTGYRTHEAVPGLDEDTTQPGSNYRGDPVAVFPILSHFDIRRNYNASTGEQDNQIIENTFDRPWYERDYMRVDWNSNAMSGPVDISFMKAYAEASDYIRETELDDPGMLVLDEDYIQVTQQVILSDGGSTCYYTYGNSNCGSAEARVRLSFARINPAEQYEAREYRDLIELTDNTGRKLKRLYLGVPLNNPVEGQYFHCTQELIDFLNSSTDARQDYTLQDCEPVSYDQSGRFGFFRQERYRYDRRVGGAHDEHREFTAAIHNIWANPYQLNVDGTPILDESGRKVSTPFTDRKAKPIVYYLNVNFPDDLLHVAGQMANDWDGPFIGAMTAATGRDEATVRGQLEADFPGADWSYLPGDDLGKRGAFQIRRNTCSKPGVSAYLFALPLSSKADALMNALEPVVGVTEGDRATRVAAITAAVERGSLPKLCAILRSSSRLLGLDYKFDWQQLGDIRYNMLNWINEPQPSGPLGYGPSAVDKETGQIHSGTANMYGASVDTYARSAADIVRAMNDDLDLNVLVSGASYQDWLESSASFGDMPIDMTEEMAQELNSRFGDFSVEEMYGSYKFEDGRINPVELKRQMQERLRNPMPGDPMYAASRVPVNEAKNRLEALKQDPEMRARLTSNQHAALVKPLYGLQANDELTSEAKNAAFDMAMDPVAFNKYQEERFKFFSGHNAYMADFVDDSIIGQALAMRGMDPEAVYKQLREEIFRAVALHEIGHTVGMTHNFEGSHDALNYPDEFWRLRAEVPEEEWRTSRMREHQYTTIMEYGSRFNSDTKGLGKYDHAAIKFAYGHHVEEFDPSVNLNSSFDFEVFANGFEGIPDLVGGDYKNISKRIDVAVEDQVRDLRLGLMDNTAKLLDNPNRSATEYWYSLGVPYGYCFDVFRGNIRCQVWDEGARFTDTVRAAIQNYWNYYVFTSYRRGRNQSGFINSYFGRQSRLSWYLTTFFRFYYFYQQWDIGIRNDLQQASLVGLNFINQVLGTPKSGPHCLDNDRNQYVPYAMANSEIQANCDPVNVPVGTGRPDLIRYNDDYLPVIDYIGSYYDKANVLTYLMNTGSNFFRVSNIGDQRAFSIGYYRVFRNELMDLLRSALFAWLGEEKGGAYSSYVMNDGVVPKALVAAEAFNQAPEDMAGMPQMYSPLGYNIVFNAVAYAAIYNTSTFDSELDFDEYIVITEKGSGDDRNYQDGWAVASFVHPHTKAVLEAAQTRDGKSISFELLNRANAFVETVWTPAADAFDRSPNDPDVRAAYEAADIKLGQYTDIISDLRYITSAVDLGAD